MNDGASNCAKLKCEKLENHERLYLMMTELNRTGKRRDKTNPGQLLGKFHELRRWSISGIDNLGLEAKLSRQRHSVSLKSRVMS